MKISSPRNLHPKAHSVTRRKLDSPNHTPSSLALIKCNASKGQVASKIVDLHPFVGQLRQIRQLQIPRKLWAFTHSKTGAPWKFLATRTATIIRRMYKPMSDAHSNTVLQVSTSNEKPSYSQYSPGAPAHLSGETEF